jgi:hypothetical protein
MASEALMQVLAVLQAAGGVTALVGTRISPLLRTQDLSLPAITLQRITLSPTNQFSGDGNLDQARVQVDCYGATYSDARGVAGAVRIAMKAVPILMTLETERFDEPPNPGVYCVTQEYEVWS